MITKNHTKNHMNLIDSYDESEEIVKAKMIVESQKKLPDTAIVCFKKELIDIVEKDKNFEEYSDIPECGDKIKIYKTTSENKDIILYKTILGGPATAAMIEEMHARGVNNFIFFGSCGELISSLKKGAFIIPTEAYRDEGTSYHYIPASDFIEVKSSKKLEEIFKSLNVNYELAKVWTTDAIFKETKDKTQKRVESGCKIVDMECASIMAVAQNRNINAYQFFYTDDNLDDGSWDIRTLIEDRSSMLSECLKIAIEIAKKI